MIDKGLCTGCSACVMVCEIGAIRMVEQNGFLYPRIDENICIGCGKCFRVCPLEKHTCTEKQEPKGYMVYTKDSELRRNSSSGGLFSLLAQSVLNAGGFVYGSVMTDDCYGAHHIEISDEKDLWRLRGSKYVQSALEDSFRKAKRRLDSGAPVLFTGTPCQIAGLRAYLGTCVYDNLLTMDVICHGVPSPMVWRKYAQDLEQRYGANLSSVSFRDKTMGWRLFGLRCCFSNGKTYTKAVTDDLYLRGFIQDLYLRMSCYCCAFKGDNYQSDITVGDFWGVDQCFPEENTDQGISLAVVQTKKGASAIETLDRCVCKPVSLDIALKSNQNYYGSVVLNPLRKRVMHAVEKYGTEKILHRYCSNEFLAKVRRKLAKPVYTLMK